LDEAARKRLVDNIAGHLVNAASFIQERAVKNFSQVSADFGKQLTEALKLQRLAKM
jgi:catalase